MGEGLICVPSWDAARGPWGRDRCPRLSHSSPQLTFTPPNTETRLSSMCVSPEDRTSAAALRHLDHPQLCCPISGPHSLLLEGASSTWQEGCGQRSSLFQALEPQRRDFLYTYHIHMPGQVSDWPASSHMFTPGPIRVARGWAAVIGNTAPTPRTTGLRGREGPQSAEQRKGGQVESVDLLSSYYVPITVLNTFLKFFPKITQKQRPIASFHSHKA